MILLCINCGQNVQRWASRFSPVCDHSEFAYVCPVCPFREIKEPKRRTELTIITYMHFHTHLSFGSDDELQQGENSKLLGWFYFISFHFIVHCMLTVHYNTLVGKIKQAWSSVKSACLPSPSSQVPSHTPWFLRLLLLGKVQYLPITLKWQHQLSASILGEVLALMHTAGFKLNLVWINLESSPADSGYLTLICFIIIY